MFPAVSPEALRGTPTDVMTERLALAVVVIYAVVQIALAIGHDPWLDEAQAWILASRADSPLDLLILPGEGHPPLWYWILWSLSRAVDFSHARYLTLPFAILNGWLLSRLLRGYVPVLALMLASFAVVQFWGFHFRPYTLIFTCLLSALLLDRKGQSMAATWLLVVACALHFLAGFLFAFWLFWQWHKGTPLPKLLAPAVVALAFGLLAVISGMGANTTIGPGEDVSVLTLVLEGLGWAGMIDPLRGPVVAVLTFAGLIFALRERPGIAGALIALLLVFAVATALVYGRTPWHTTFMTMLCFMAVSVAGFTRQRAWVMAILLVPQASFGVIAAQLRLSNPVWAHQGLYELVRSDAGADFVPDRDLVGWPNLVIPPYTATYGIEMVDGNSGELMGPVDWSIYKPELISDVFVEMEGPYWLICAACELIVAHLQDEGRSTTLLGEKFMIDHGAFGAYRVD